MELVRQVVVEWLALLCRSLTLTVSNLNMDIVFLKLDFSNYPQPIQYNAGMVLTCTTSASSRISYTIRLSWRNSLRITPGSDLEL